MRPIVDLAKVHSEELERLEETARINRLCELNVLAQADLLAQSKIVRTAWEKGQPLQIHSWIYQIESGKLEVLREPFVSASA